MMTDNILTKDALLEILNGEVSKAIRDHDEKVRDGHYSLKRDIEAGDARVEAISYMRTFVKNSRLEVDELAEAALKECETWNEVKQRDTQRHLEGHTSYKNLIVSYRFFEGIKYMTDVITKHLASDEGVVL